VAAAGATQYRRGVPDGTPRELDPNALGDHVDRLYRAAWALCGDRHDAEDLVQETYARVLAKPRLVRREDDLGYLLRALRNVHFSRLRRLGRRVAEVPLEDEPEAEARFDVRAPEAAYEVAELFRAIAALPREAAEAVVAVDVVGLSYAEAATALRVKEATLTTRLFRARRRVARTLEPDGVRL
jgi:RNA polymerase sigma-70 factor (ECF subfamily)